LDALLSFASRAVESRTVLRESWSVTDDVCWHADRPRRISRTCWLPSIRFSARRVSLGEQSKDETRRSRSPGCPPPQARKRKRVSAGDDYRRFQRQDEPVAGNVVDEGGNVVGRHDGYWRFTPGQRRGLGIAAARPLYVLRTDGVLNEVVVGRRDALAASRVEADGVLYAPISRVEAKLRYRSDPVFAAVSPLESGFSLDFEQPSYAVARGQVAALYDGEAVVGAGVVTDVS
jgi:tRNA-specific 2-thiouridylase